MRTAEICPTCATYTNAVCVIYDGPYLSTIGVSPMDDLQTSLIAIDSTLSTIISTCCGGASNVVNRIIAGTNITISPSGGTGDVTINATGGGGIAALLPQPILQIPGGGNNNIIVQFPDTGLDYTNSNPEVFLFRWRNRGKSKVYSPTLSGLVRRGKLAKWAHPCTVDANTKWQGWKFFSGEQAYDDGTLINDRVTEWTVPSTYKPYEHITIQFNKYMFWYATQDPETVSGLSHDINYFNPTLGYGFGPQYHNEAGLDGNPDIPIIKVGSVRSKDGYLGNSQKFALAIAIDNPAATKTNGLCPKIFGPLSEPFYSRISTASDPVDIILVNGASSRHLHIKWNGDTTGPTPPPTPA